MVTLQRVTLNERGGLMLQVEEQVNENDNFRTHIIHTDKFKTETIIVQIKRRMTSDDVAIRALLPYVLQSATNNYPSVKKIRTRLEELYGAVLTCDLSKKGDHHIITFRLDVVSHKYLFKDEQIFTEALALLAEVLFDPKTNADGVFDENIVNQEKRTLKQKISALFDDKMRYANMRLVEEMCASEPYQQHVYGSYAEVDQITSRDLYTYYEQMLTEDEIDVYIVGNREENETQAHIDTYFKFPEKRQVNRETTDFHLQEIDSEKEVIEEQDIYQSKLNIGYRTPVSYKDPDYATFLVFNGIFGGFSHSKLFMNVRERESLAYYAASRIESHKGFLFVMSGIEASNYEKTVAIIKAEMAKMQSGDFSDEELAQTKTMIKNQILETLDDQRGIVELLYHQVVARHERTVAHLLQSIEGVTRDMVMTVANKAVLDTVYFLKGKEG